MGRKRTCELPFCNGVVEGSRNKHRCDNDRNIHLHQVISKNVKKIMQFIESHGSFTANDVNRELFKGRLDKNEKGSLYRLFQAMVREKYLLEGGKDDGLKVYVHNPKGSGRRRSRSARSEVAPEAGLDQNGTSGPPASRDPELSPADLLRAKLKEFVYTRNGQYQHDDWLWLINRPDIRALGFSEADVGRLLEEEKARYWSYR